MHQAFPLLGWLFNKISSWYFVLLRFENTVYKCMYGECKCKYIWYLSGEMRVIEQGSYLPSFKKQKTYNIHRQIVWIAKSRIVKYVIAEQNEKICNLGYF